MGGVKLKLRQGEIRPGRNSHVLGDTAEAADHVLLPDIQEF
jgi:hypothetical protein